MKTTQQGSTVERLVKTGAHFAQVKSRRHPSMKPYLVGHRARFEILDLAKTEEQLEAAKAVMNALAKEGKTVLFVGGKAEISNALKAAAKSINQPYVGGRWLGGTISNFVEIKKRIERLADLTGKRESGELAKQYTKLERVRIDREIERLQTRLEGVEELAKRPDALLIVDAKHEAHATKEAKDARIPIIAIMGSDNNVKDATYPVVANDASKDAVTYLLGELATAYAEGKKA